MVAFTVELTINEVSHAHGYEPTDLVVVDGIEWSRSDSGIAASGGRLCVGSDWAPDDVDRDARRFAYSLPQGEQPIPLPLPEVSLD